MSEQKDLNSTERLLNRIRDNKTNQSSPSPSTNRIEQSTSNKKILKQSLVVGVIIGEHYISLSMTGENKVDHKKELIKWQRVAVSDSMQVASSRFPAFLKTTLDTFIGKDKGCDIWTCIDIKELKHKNIIVPDLPDSKVANAALWGLKKEYEIQPDQEVFDFEILSDVIIDGIKKREVSAFTGKSQKINLLKKVFSTAGYPLAGITAMPFAFQNYYNEDVIQPAGFPFALVNISRTHSDICCFSESRLLLVRNIRSGSSSIAEELAGDLHDTTEPANVVELLSADFGIDSLHFENMKGACDRLISKIVRTGDYCSHNMAANAPIEQYLVFGETDNSRAFMEYAKSQIPTLVDIFKPLESMTQNSISINPPVNSEDRNAIIPATAVSLSSNQITPNFLYTYVDKEIEARYKKINTGIITAACLILALCLGCWIMLDSNYNKFDKQLTSIEKQLDKYDPTITEPLLSKRIDQARQKSKLLKQYSTDYTSLAIINELCQLTPNSILIEIFDLDYEYKQEKNLKNKKEEKIIKRAVINGVVQSDHTSLETDLTGFAVKLEDSPLFKSVIVKDKSVDMQKSPDVLRFRILLEVM